MKAFAQLYAALDETNQADEKVEALVRYFQTAPPADAAWAIHFLVGRKPRPVVPAPKLREWCIGSAGIAEWLFDESHAVVGDVAETVALMMDDQAADGTGRPLHEWVEAHLLALRGADEASQRDIVQQVWREMDSRQRLVWNKLITGTFRVGVSHKLVVRALARVSGLDEATITHRLTGAWEPAPEFYAMLLAPETRDADISRPYPFFLARPLGGQLTESAGDAMNDEMPDLPSHVDDWPAFLAQRLGDVRDWQAEWKWDGIRSQVIRRNGQTFVWSRGDELVTERFPEIAAIGDALPDGTVIDGEIVPYRAGRVLPFGELQTRVGRKSLTKKMLAEVPVALIAFDLLELDGQDVRHQELRWRRAALERLVDSVALPQLIISPRVMAGSWTALVDQHRTARAHAAAGLMLKQLGSAYEAGRVAGGWWKWKAAPHTVDAVLMYAQTGQGQRASLYTDYTFGVWDADKLAPFAKADSGLTDDEIRRIDRWVRQNTLERFGPVRVVQQELVFELAFDSVQRSPRHKSGLAVRLPRILRWRTDKRAEEADSLDTIRALM